MKSTACSATVKREQAMEISRLNEIAQRIAPPFGEHAGLIERIIDLSDAIEGDTDLEGIDEREPDDEQARVAAHELNQSPVELRRGKRISTEEKE
jgi:hypothetical protein